MSLSLRIITRTVDRRVPRMRRSGLTFTKVAPGGPTAMQVTINMPLAAFPDLGPDSKVYLYRADGSTAWEGFADAPGKNRGRTGESFDLSATGITTLTTDRAQPLHYIVTALDYWTTGGVFTLTAGTSAATGSFPDGSGVRAGDPGIVCQFPSGMVLGDGAGQAAMFFAPNSGSSQYIAGVVGYVEGGKVTSDFETSVALYQPPTHSILAARTAALTNLGAAFDWVVGDAMGGTTGDTFPALCSVLLFSLNHPGAATNVADDNTWSALAVDRILGSRMDAAGDDVRPLPRTSYVLASEVVADLCGRMLVDLDPTRVSITATTYEIDALDYNEATRMGSVLDDLEAFEADMTWEMLPSDALGRYGFEYRPWGDTPRYELSVVDGFQQPGGDTDLCNRVAVTWTDATGATQTRFITAEVPELGDRVRDADPVSLPDGTGSIANAQRVGQAVLGGSLQPAAATATVVRRIFDHQRGTFVHPEEIEPGYLARVRELGLDMRITQVDYSEDDQTAALTLGTPAYDTDQLANAAATGRTLRTYGSPVGS